MRNARVVCIVVCALLCLLGVSNALLAQTDVAEVTGRVMDPNGAVIIEATVTAKNVDTGVETIVQTNPEGIYRFASLTPGNYEFTVSKHGFKVIVKPGVTLHVADTISLNFNMVVGALTESVTVQGGAPMINTTDASVSTVVDQSYVANMPLNGRSLQDLILLTPGVLTQTPQSPGIMGGTGDFSVNGQRTEENYYTVDGVSANIGAATGPTNFLFNTQTGGASGSVAGATEVGTTQALVSLDDLQEFRVESSTYSAESGRNPGAQIALQTKSGTNQWHGSAFDYLRNGYFDAQDWFNNYLKTKAPALHQNDFGGRLAGPVTIPGMYNGKNKTFFDFSYEGLRLQWPQPPSINIGVPDLCLRGVTSSCSAGETPVTPELLPVVNAFPLPTPGGTNFGDGTAQYIASWSNPSSIDSTSVRFDQVIGAKHRLFFRFSNTDSSSATRGLETIGSGPSVNTIAAATTRTYTGGATSIFSSRLTNDVRVNYSTNEPTSNQFISPIGGAVNVDLRPASGVGAAAQTQFCFFNLAGTCIGLSQAQWSAAQKQWNLVDTVSLSLGRHQFKFGADYRRLSPNAIAATPIIGYDYFDEPSLESNSATGIVQAQNPAYPLYQNFSAFGQDEWHMAPRLTLSMGLRWEVYPAPTATQGLMPYTLQGPNPNNFTLAPQGTSLWKTTWYNFAPRLGAAYMLRTAPGWETVVRGGGGVYFDSGQQTGSLGFAGPGFNSLVIGFGSYNVNGSWCFFTPDFSQLNCSISTPGAAVAPIDNPPTNLNNATGFSPHLQLPYALHWNASVEQSLGKNQTLTVSYVGSHDSRLIQTNLFSTPSGQFFLVQNGSTSYYGALQAQFLRRLSQGLTAMGAYTWSHCIDYGSTNFFYGYRRGNCDFDVRHNFAGALSYDLPNVGHGGLMGALLNHWGIDDRFTARTGFPINLTGNAQFDPMDGKRYQSGLTFTGQPVYVFGANCDAVLQAAGELQAGQGCPGGKALNPNAFKAVPCPDPSVACFGNVPRNFARLFGAWQMNMAVRREFPITESLKLQFRAEAFNIFNHANFGNVDSSLGDFTFGLATSTLANALNTQSALYQFGGPRSMQFALKVIF